MTTQTTTGRNVDTTNLVRVSDLQDRSVHGSDDQEIGVIGDVYMDYDEHTVRYVTMDVGGFLGIGAKTVLVPFERLQWMADGDSLYLDAEREQIEEAPEFDPMGGYDREYEETVATAWGTPAYWATGGYGASHAHWRGR